MPSIFPGCPKYLSKTVVPRKSPRKRTNHPFHSSPRKNSPVKKRSPRKSLSPTKKSPKKRKFEKKTGRSCNEIVKVNLNFNEECFDNNNSEASCNNNNETPVFFQEILRGERQVNIPTGWSSKVHSDGKYMSYSEESCNVTRGVPHVFMNKNMIITHDLKVFAQVQNIINILITELFIL